MKQNVFKRYWQRWPKSIRYLFIVCVSFILIFSGWGSYSWYQLDNAPLKGDSRLFTVSKGKKAVDLVDELSEQPLSHFWAQVWLKLHPEYSQVKAGTFKIEKGWLVKHALQVFVSGREAVFSVTLVEGKRIEDWLETLSKSPYISSPLTTSDLSMIRSELGIEQDNIEGWFLPETYSYTVDTRAIDLLRRAHQEMEAFLDKKWQSRDKSVPYQTPYEALIMASIIEKETAQAKERPRIASVFINRLEKNMKLQTDPTVIYGVKDQYNGNITRKNLEDNNPYNTYVINGLPPTPIALPSKEAIVAALHPDKSNYLYFVAKGGGEHHFSTSLAEHNRAVKQYILRK